jgi:hypothetical protein
LLLVFSLQLTAGFDEASEALAGVVARGAVEDGGVRDAAIITAHRGNQLGAPRLENQVCVRHGL